MRTHYATLTLICDGAFEEEWEFDDEDNMMGEIERLRKDSLKHPDVEYTLYILEHPHSPSVACECAQYVLDHKPARTFNPKEH